jgi:hypothetical protein
VLTLERLGRQCGLLILPITLCLSAAVRSFGRNGVMMCKRHRRNSSGGSRQLSDANKRVCFSFVDGDAHEVEKVNYH